MASLLARPGEVIRTSLEPVRAPKVLLVGNYVSDGQASMQAFLRVLERELPKLGCDVRVIVPPRRLQRVPHTSRWWKWLG